jgi:hypothetical protein
MAQTFKLADKPDPWMDGKSKLAFLIKRQLRGYSVHYKPVTPQAAMTPSILREFYKTSITKYDDSLCELFTVAFFFTM